MRFSVILRDSIDIVPMSRKLNNNSFIALASQPFQRGPRYSMLLLELQKSYRKLADMNQPELAYPELSNVIKEIGKMKDYLVNQLEKANKGLEEQLPSSLLDVENKCLAFEGMNKNGAKESLPTVDLALMQAVRKLNEHSLTDSERKTLYVIMTLASTMKDASELKQQKNELSHAWIQVLASVKQNENKARNRLFNSNWKHLHRAMRSFRKACLDNAFPEHISDDMSYGKPKSDASGNTSPDSPDLSPGSSPDRQSEFFIEDDPNFFNDTGSFLEVDSASVVSSFTGIKEKSPGSVDVTESFDDSRLDFSIADAIDIDIEDIEMDKPKSGESEKESSTFALKQMSEPAKQSQDSDLLMQDLKEAERWKKIVGYSLILFVIAVIVTVCLLATLPSFGVSLGILGVVSPFLLAMIGSLLGQLALASAGAGLIAVGVLGGVLALDSKKSVSLEHEKQKPDEEVLDQPEKLDKEKDDEEPPVVRSGLFSSGFFSSVSQSKKHVSAVADSNTVADSQVKSSQPKR